MSERAWEKVRGAEIAAIFQEPGLALNPVLCVGDQIAEVIRAHRGWNGSRRRAEAESLLDQVRLSDELREILSPAARWCRCRGALPVRLRALNVIWAPPRLCTALGAAGLAVAS